VREADGLAMSSRNRFLTEQERATAPLLARTLRDVAVRLAAGEEGSTALATARDALSGSGFDLDYVALVDGPTLAPIAAPDAMARLIGAARLGTVRLLDNTPALPESSGRALGRSAG
jgi:pantoate--beta-alanine ligase